MSETVQASDGTQLPISSLPQQFAYSGSFVSSITALYQGKTFVQTFLNNGTNIIYVSGWELFPTPLPEQIMVSENGTIMVDESGTIMVSQ